MPDTSTSIAEVVQLQIRMPKAMHEKLRRRAFKERRAIAAVARILIEDGLNAKPETRP